MQWGQLSDILQPLFTTAEGYSNSLVPLGKTITELAVTLTVFNEVLQFWVGGGVHRLMGKLIRLAIITSIPVAALTSWSTWGPMNGSLVNFFTTEVTGAITGSTSGGAFGTIAQSVNAMFAAFPTLTSDGATSASSTSTAGTSGASTPASPYPATAVNCTNVMSGTVGAGASFVSAGGTCPSGFVATPYVPPSTTTYPAGAEGVATGGPTGTPEAGSGWVYAITHLGATITKTIAIVLLFIPTLILAVAMIFALYGPLLMLLIGIVFGPVLIAWLPFEPLANLATTWLRYMVSMGIAFAIGILLATIGTAALKQFTAALATMDASLASFGAFIGGVLATTAGMLFLAYMMFKVEHIAAGLVGGPAIGGGGGFLGFAAGRAARLASSKSEKSENKNAATSAGGQPSSGGQGAAGGATQSSGGGQGVAGGGAPTGATPSALSAQAANASQAASGAQASMGDRLRSAAGRALRSDVTKAAVFAAAGGIAGPVGALAAGGGIMAAKAAGSMRQQKGAASSAPQAPSQALANTKPVRKVHVPAKYKP